MRQIRYSVASSLDGFLAGPHGEIDWIPADDDVDFSAFRRYDTLLIGRHTFELMIRQGQTTMPGMRSVVISTTLQSADHPEVTISSDVRQTIADLRASAGKDIWLFGGGRLFRTLLDLGEVDAVDISVLPVLLGEGIPLLPPPYTPANLSLTEHRVYPRSGIVSLQYSLRTAHTV